MKDLVISIIDICSKCTLKIWFQVFLRFHVLMPDGVCTGCALCKQHQDPFPKGKTSRAKAPLELVHSDLMTFSTPFLGTKYTLTFIDDFSRYSWVYFLKYKSEVFATFKTFKALLGKQSSCSIKKLHTDNGENMLARHFKIFAKNVAFFINILFHTPLSKMV